MKPIWLAFLLSLAIAPAKACPQSSVLHFVVPFPPGGSYDVLARNIAEGLSARTGQKILVENRSGGNGEVGTAFVAKSARDGCTLVFWGDGIIINQVTVPNRQVDVIKDFAPVALVARTAQTLVARADFKAKNLKELIELSRQPGADIRYATAGVGTPGHLVIELLNSKTGSRLRHVPYRGGALALTDLLGGHVDLVSTGLPALMGQIKSGQIVAVAVSPQKRTAILPDVPTMSEIAPGVYFETWYGFLAPVETPPAVIEKLHTDIAAVMKVPALSNKLVEQGFEILDEGPAQLQELVRNDLTRLREIVEISGLSR